MTRSASLAAAAKRYYQGGVKVSIGGVPCRMARKPGEFYSKAVREGQHGFDKVSTAAVRQGEANYARECLEAMGLEVPEAPVHTSWYGGESKSKAWDAECVRAYLDALAAAGRPQVVTDVVDESGPMLDLEPAEAPEVVEAPEAVEAPKAAIVAPVPTASVVIAIQNHMTTGRVENGELAYRIEMRRAGDGTIQQRHIWYRTQLGEHTPPRVDAWINSHTRDWSRATLNMMPITEAA